VNYHQLKTPLRWLHEKGLFSLLSANFLTQFLGFGTALLVAKFLTPVELGEIKILQNYANLFGIIAAFGLNTAILKFCAENREEQEKEFILRFSVMSSLVTTLVALLLLATLALTGVIISSQYLAFWLLIYAITIPFSTLTGFFMVYLQALKKINEMAKAQAIIRVQFFIVIVVSTWLWGFKGFIFATIFAYFAGLIPLLKQVGLNFLVAVRGKVPVGFANIVVFSALGGGVSALSQYGDIFILDHFGTDRANIGYYSLALTFTLAASQITGTVQSIVTPYFSEHSQDETWTRSQMMRNQVRMSALSLGVASIMYGLAWVLVQVFFGQAYQSTLTYLAILLVKYVVWSSYSIIGGAFVGLGLIRYGFVLAILTTPITLFLSYKMLEIYGVVGVAWAQVGGALLTFVLMLFTYRMELHKYFNSLPKISI
jgi:O-antigen/teichoic acid export membrane protein